jgi:hypothetical protein
LARDLMQAVVHSPMFLRKCLATVSGRFSMTWKNLVACFMQTLVKRRPLIPASIQPTAMNLILRIAIIALVSSGFALSAEPKKTEGAGKTAAKTDKSAKKSDDAAKPMHLPLKGMVLAITTRTLTVKGGEGKEDRKFTINKDTAIVKGEAAATVGDVKVGQTITGSYIKSAEGPNTLTKLQVAPKLSEPKKKTEAKEGDSKTKKGEEEPKKKAS